MSPKHFCKKKKKQIRKKILDIERDISDNVITYNRSIMLNNNFNRWTWEYIKILLVFLGFLFVVVFFYKLQLFIIVYIITVIGSFSLLLLFSNISNRDDNNFDEINSNRYTMISNQNISKMNDEVLNKNIPTEPVPYCIGSKCCFTGTVWDSKEAKCVKL